jgi:hypothetical protein
MADVQAYPWRRIRTCCATRGFALADQGADTRLVQDYLGIGIFNTPSGTQRPIRRGLNGYGGKIFACYEKFVRVLPMTWIVGMAHPLGYAMAISDIRVTLGNGSEIDGVQKIYMVGRYIALGFSGSVAIGFEMAHTLSTLLYHPDPNNAWIPSEVAKWWQFDAQKVFNRVSKLERDGKSHLMLIGVDPNKNNGDSPWAKSEVYTFFSPNFSPMRSKPLKPMAIGSGSHVKPYSRMLRTIARLNDSLMQMEVGMPGGMSRGYADSMTDEINKVHVKGISPHLHICRIFRGKIELSNNDRLYIGKDGSQAFKMPSVATSWNEWQRLAQMQGFRAEGACC